MGFDEIEEEETPVALSKQNPFGWDDERDLIVFNKYGEKAEEFEEAKFEFAEQDAALEPVQQPRENVEPAGSGSLRGPDGKFVRKEAAEKATQAETGAKEADLLMPTFRIPGETTLKNNVGKSISEMSPKEKTDQYLMLREFLKYAKMGEQMFHVTQGSNYDTSSFNDPYLVFKKQMQQIKAQNTIISSVDWPAPVLAIAVPATSHAPLHAEVRPR